MKSGFKALITALGLGLALGGASIAQADDYGYRTWDRQEQHRHHDRGRDSRAWAKVTRVEPIYTTVRVAEPIEECWQERAPAGYHAGYESHTPTVVGGLIGGLLGNQVGQGTGNVLATVGGALLGGSVGRDVGRAHDRGPGYYEEVTTRRCATRTGYRTEQRIDGYRVEYRYRGRIYSTITDYPPGDRIPVDVVVRPAHR